jgi:hypothetical protein
VQTVYIFVGSSDCLKCVDIADCIMFVGSTEYIECVDSADCIMCVGSAKIYTVCGHCRMYT